MDVFRDVGALQTRLVPGFLTDTRLEPGARVVTFANGMVIKEPIVDVDERNRRLVWTAVGGPLTHTTTAPPKYSRMKTGAASFGPQIFFRTKRPIRCVRWSMRAWQQ